MNQLALPQRFAEASQSLIGTKFRLHGRDPSVGLDCVGLVTASLALAGIQPTVPTGYRLRNRSIEKWLRFADLNGFSEVHAETSAGDLLLCLAGPAQFHLVICALHGNAFVHAHAGLGAVVTTPGPLHWPPLKHWRLPAMLGE